MDKMAQTLQYLDLQDRLALKVLKDSTELTVAMEAIQAWSTSAISAVTLPTQMAIMGLLLPVVKRSRLNQSPTAQPSVLVAFICHSVQLKMSDPSAHVAILLRL